MRISRARLLLKKLYPLDMEKSEVNAPAELHDATVRNMPRQGTDLVLVNEDIHSHFSSPTGLIETMTY